MRRSILTFSLLGLAILAPVTRAATITAVQSGDWEDPATWGGTVPTILDGIVINGFTVTRGPSSVVANATFGGNAVINGAASAMVEIEGPVSWGAMTFTSTGGLGLVGNTTLGGTELFAYQILTSEVISYNNATVTVISPANNQYGLYDNGSGTALWSSRGTFALTGCASIHGGIGSVFTNEASGTFVKSGGGAAFVQWAFANDGGTVSVQSGSLEMRHNPLSGNGTYQVDAGATLYFNGNTLNANTTVTGAGALVPLGTIVGNGTLVSNGQLAWTSGTFSNPGGLRIGANGTAQLGAADYFSYQMLYNGATGITAENFGNVTLVAPPNNTYGLYDNGANSTLWLNRAGSQFALTGCASIHGRSTFTNDAGASFVKSGAGTSSIQWNFVNEGGFTVQEGSVVMNGNNLSGAAAYNVAANATLQLSATHLASNVTTGGAGTVIPLNTIVGNGTLVSNGRLAWTSGVFNNPGGLRIGANGTAQLGATDYFSYQMLYNGTTGITVENLGRATLVAPPSNTYGLYDNGAGNSHWINRAGAQFTLTGCASIHGSANSTITNESGATFAHAGAGASAVFWSFTNNGAIDVQAGVLSFQNASFGGTNGTVSVAANATLQFQNESLVANTVVGGSGVVTFDGANTLLGPTQLDNARFNSGVIAGPGSLTVTQSLAWLSAFGAGGGLVIGPNATATLGAADYFSYQFISNVTGVAVQNYGDATLVAPPLNTYGLYDNGTGTSSWFNKAGALFTLTGCASIHGQTGSTLTNEAGAVLAHSGNGTSLVTWSLDNRGVVSVDGGALSLSGPVAQNDAGNSTLTGGAWVVNANSTLLFPGSPNYTTIGANASVTLSGNGSVFDPAESATTIFGGLQISGGRQFSKAANFGVFNGTLDVNGGGSLFATTGQVSVFGGQVTVADGAGMTLGALDLGNGGASVMSVGLGAGASTLTVANALVGSGAGGSATLNLHNGGTVNVTGNLFLSASAGVPSAVNLNSGGLLQVGGVDGIAQTHGNYTFNWNGGVLKVAGGDLTSAINFQLGGAGATFLSNGFGATLSGNLTGNGSLVKQGLGALSLTGNNSYHSTFVRAGNVSVTGSGAVLAQTTLSGQVVVGSNAGDMAAFHVQNGGRVTSSLATFGAVAGSQGGGLIVGANATWNNSGPMSVGEGGEGSLFVGDHGHLTSANAVLGNLTTGNGTAVVLGGNATFTVSSTLTVGHQGLGNLSVLSGGMVHAGAMTAGGMAGGNGTITVDGANSTLTSPGTIIIGSAGVASLTVSGGARVSGNNTYLAVAAGGSGAVTVTGANSTLTTTRTLTVGDTGSGALTISDGGAVSSNFTFISPRVNSNGTVLVTGTGSRLTANTLTISSVGPGGLSVAAGGRASGNNTFVGVLAGANGTVQVTGTNSLFTTTHTLTLGDAGRGGVTVSSGGAVAANHTILGNQTAGNGTVLITGPNSTLTSSFSLKVGSAGAGGVTISNGGRLDVAPTYLGSSENKAYLGYTATGVGTVLITGANSTWTQGGTSQFYIGYDGVGSLTVADGGRLDSWATHVGATPTGTGTVVVTGANSTWQLTNGFLKVGNTGHGSVTVSDGGTLTGIGTDIGLFEGGHGEVKITGVGSTWTMEGNDLFVGQAGNGSLIIENGGKLTSSFVVIGNALTSTSTALVTGAGARWEVVDASPLQVGNAGTGSLTISNGGVLDSWSVHIGNYLSGNGAALVTGANSTWTLRSGSLLTIGDASVGSLTVSNGGRVSASSAILGNVGTGNGTLNINGANSTVTAGEAVVVGQAGDGVLNIFGGSLTSNGGTLGANGGSSGSLFLMGGSWNAGTANLSIGGLGVGWATVAGQLTGNIVKIGAGGTGDGEVLVEGVGARLQANNTLYIGESGLGELSVIASANLANGGNAWIGFNANSTGTVLVANALWTSNGSIVVGNSGRGTLTIDDDGVVSVTNGNPLLLATFGPANATVNLKSGGLLKVRGADGILAGSGSYAFNWNGGTVQAVGANFTTAINAVLTPNATAIFDSNGLGSTWSGVLSDNGSFQKEGLGTLTLTGNNTYTGNTTVLAGTLAVSGSSARINTPAANLTVGTTGAANLTVSGGGNVTGNFVALGANATGNGTLTVTGSNSRVVVANNLTIGQAGAGSLLINNGGNLAMASGFNYINLGNTSGASGSILISGPGSVLGKQGSSTATLVAAGAAGNGTGSITVTNGGTLAIGDHGIVRLGFASNSSGALLVDGANSTVSLYSLGIGENGVGNLTVRNGGFVNSPFDEVILGNFVGSEGTATVDGAGSKVNAGSALVIGRGGVGTFSVLNGGNATSVIRSTELGVAAGSSGTLLVTGAGSVAAASNLTAGISGSSTITVGDGGVISVLLSTTLAANLGSNSTFNLNSGGTFAVGFSGLNAGLGNYAFNWNGGTLRVTGNHLATSINATLLPAATASNLDTNGFDATWSGVISGGDSFAKSGNGTLVLSGNNTLSGLVAVQAGTLQVGAGGDGGALGTAAVQNNGSLVFNRTGTLTVSGNIFGGGSVAKNGSGAVHLAGHNTYTGATAVNAGTLTAVNGLNGTSTVTVQSGARLSLGGNSSASALILNGGLLSLNGTILVSASYLNANFGVGNSFDAHAHVSGNGTINAAGDTAQSVSGADITGGGTATPVLTLPSVHEGGTVMGTYAIANAGNTGPQLLGAIQNSLITDPRLSGSGVTAQNWGPLAGGASTSNFTVALNGTTAGPLAANQSVALVNNFDNVADQVLAIQGGSVFRLASATQPAAVDLGIVHVGESVIYSFNIANTAGDTGGYTENLGVAVGSVGAGLSANGSISGLGPSAPASQNISVTLNTTVAGLLAGANVTLNYTSQALSGSGLANTPLPPQTTTFNGTINRYADPAFSKISGDGSFTIVGPEEMLLDFGDVLSGTGPYVANLRLTNAALAPADWLAGNFTFSDPSGQFSFGGFTAFDDLQSGQFISLTVTYLATASGDFNGSVTLHAFSENSGGFSGNLGAFVLNVHGAVPEPSTYAAMAGVLALAAAVLRRRRRGRDELHPHKHE